MAKFCTWCGAPLEPGARFCGECGGRILETVTIDGSKDAVDSMRGFDIVDGRNLPADATLRMDRDALVVPTDNDPKRFSLESGAAPRRAPLIAAGAAVVVLLLAGGVAAAVYFGGWSLQRNEPAPESAPVAQDTAPEASEAAAQDDAPAVSDVSSAALTDAQAYDELAAAYSKLSVYDERIAGDGGLIEDFNGLFLASSLDERTRAKDTADKVLSDLQADKDALNALDIDADSPYESQRVDVSKLYEYQIGRVSALTDAWALDVTFETPSEHKDEILAVYTKGSSNGEAKYLTLYDELYSEAKPTAVS